MIRLLTEPFSAPYMQRALVEAVMLGVLGGIVGVHVILRRLEFMADALTHTVFPGMAAAFVVGGSLYVGALVTGAISAVLLTMLTRNRRVTSDAALAVLLTGFFSLGVILISRSHSYTADLTVLLFGRVLAIDLTEIAVTAATGIFTLIVIWMLHKELVLRSFDPIAAEALGYRVVTLDLVLNVIITLVVVASVKAVGSVLVIALLITPAAIARLIVARSVAKMMAIAALFGAAGGWLGLVVSYEGSVHHGLRLASGATIVLTLTTLFFVSLLVVVVTRFLRSKNSQPALTDSDFVLSGDAFPVGP
ncbi:MAG: metal ABC transporter permease [Actinomycetes bacterium]